jgi:hypothetical protein
MRVRCTQLVATAGPSRGQPVASTQHLAVGDEFLVLAILIDASAIWPILLCLDRGRDAFWEPAVMFEAIDARLSRLMLAHS